MGEAPAKISPAPLHAKTVVLALVPTLATALPPGLVLLAQYQSVYRPARIVELAPHRTLVPALQNGREILAQPQFAHRSVKTEDHAPPDHRILVTVLLL